MTNTTTQTRLGQSVTYFDSNGRQKAALVIGTTESTQNGSVESPEEGHAHLTIFNPSGNRYTRMDVREASEDEESPTQAFRA